MDLTFSQEELAFRDELRQWLIDHHPGEEPNDDDEAFAFGREWQAQLHAAGWAGVHWPAEYGGRGASLIESAIFNEELARARVPSPVNVLGLTMGGPVVMTHGNEEQKERYLEPILSAEEIWCQGFSEPDAGSDLAAVKTRAVKDGDEWVVTGQKVWTSHAQRSKWCMLVARTDPSVAKHKGLTYFLMDMDQAEIDVRPLRQITGGNEFNELFIDGARIPEGNIVGGIGHGWQVALTTLMNERAGIGFGFQVQMKILLDQLTEAAEAKGLLQDPAFAERIGRLHIRTEVLRLTAYRGLTAEMKYGRPGPEGSLGKLMWSKTNQDVTELASTVLGPEALRSDSRWAYDLLRARGNTIEGGTTEILKNIVAERVLGLPRLRQA